MNDNITKYKGEIVTESTSVQKCSVISVKNGSATLTKFALIDLNGVTLYRTDRYSTRETCTIDLTKKSMVEGTQFRLKALVTAGDDDTSEIILEYDSTGPIAKFILRGSTFKTDLVFEGTVEPTLSVTEENDLQ